MNENRLNSQCLHMNKRALMLALGLSLVFTPLAATVNAADSVFASDSKTASLVANAGVIDFSPRINATLGKSALLKLPDATSRVSIGDKDIADIILINPRELYLLGKKVGTTNVIIWGKNGQSTVVDINVGMDASGLQGKLQQIMPGEKNIVVSNASDSLVVSGSVFDATKVDRVMLIAEAYAGKKVVNMLSVSAPQQVMLEVKMAEVSKSILDKLGASFSATRSNGGVAYAIASGFLGLQAAGGASGGGLLTITKDNTTIKIDAENKDGLIKILAEPNIMAVSGQEGSFLAGGKIFIPVPQGTGTNTITLEEKDFGVGLRFTPTVLEGNVINLRVTPEVSELSATGTTISAAGFTSSVLPSFTIRRASTTVQLRDGQSFAIAGLIKNNVTETIRRFPILGEIPIIGALFRSSAFQTDKTELLFVITPRLVKPLPADYALPTDSFVEPSKAEFFLGGKLEGAGPAIKDAAPGDKPQSGTEPVAPTAEPATPADGSGFEMK